MLQESKAKAKKSRKEPLKKKSEESAAARPLPTGLIVSQVNQVKSRRKKVINDDEGGSQADDE